MFSILSVCNSVCPRGGGGGRVATHGLFKRFAWDPLPVCLGRVWEADGFSFDWKALFSHCVNSPETLLLRWLSWNRCSMKHLNVSAESWFTSFCQVVPEECWQTRWATIVGLSIILCGIYEKHCGVCFWDITIVISHICILLLEIVHQDDIIVYLGRGIFDRKKGFLLQEQHVRTEEMLMVSRKLCVFFSSLKACNVMNWPWGAAISVRALTSTLCALWIPVMLK